MSTLAARARCHCGSGRAYKDCHMPEDKAREAEEQAWDDAMLGLRRDLIRFAQSERFAQAFAEAIGLFWDGHYTIQTASQMNEDESLRFFDWFAHDHHAFDGKRLVDLFAAEQGS